MRPCSRLSPARFSPESPRLKALPIPKYKNLGIWEEAESRRAADTAAEASCRSHASGSGARGFDAGSWGAGYGGDVGRADRHAGG
jgi:hypothetical protein